MRNCYKRTNVFRCSNPTHAKFDKKVSVYHVLKVRNCYPNGCVYFLWRCQKLNKGEACPRGYQHVGRKCFGCKFFYDEKVNNQLEVALQDGSMEQFWTELQEFEDWLQEVQGRTFSIFGEVKSVKPRFKKQIIGDKSWLKLQGFLLVFDECYIGNTHFEDHAFVIVSTRLHKRLQFAPGDRLEFQAVVQEDRGRIVFEHLRRIEFERKNSQGIWTESEARVALATATEFPQQPESCFYCEHGALVDVFASTADGEQYYRHLYCLKSIADPHYCYVRALETLTDDGCPPESTMSIST